MSQEHGQDARGTREVTTRWQIVRLGAATLAELAQRAGKASSRAAELMAQAGSLRFGHADRCRLAIVAEGAEDLAAKLALAAGAIGTPKAVMLARKDVFVGEVANPPGKVAFLFSGQGSQYPGMLRALIDEFPPAAETLREIDDVLRRLELPTFDQFAGPASDVLGKDVWLTQLSLLCADTIVYRSLGALGIRPDVVAGHSYGEFPALLAAGAWDFENAVLGTRARCRAIETCREVTGQMISVAAPGPVVEQVCRELGGQLYPANYNSPSQTVVGGDVASIARLEARLVADKIACKVIPVPRPFHTPLLDPVRGPLAEGLRPIVFRRPVVPMLSSVTNRLIDEPEEIRANLVAQMTSPVRYVELVEQLAESGTRAMVEVGPHRVLTGLHEKTLAGRNAVAIASDDKTRAGVSRLLAVVARLDVLGLLDGDRRRPAIDVFGSATAAGATGDTDDSAQSALSFGMNSIAESSVPPEGLVLDGTPDEMGHQHGEARADEIRRVARRWADVAGMTEPWEAAGNGDGVVAKMPDELGEELRGIADAAGVSAEMLTRYNEWIDRHAVENAVQVAARADGTVELLHTLDERPVGSGPWADFAVRRELRVYRPRGGLAHAVVSWPGVVGGSAGINERGLSITSAAPAPEDRASNVPLRTALVHVVLARAATIDEASLLLRQSAVRSGYEFVLAEAATNRICHVRFGEDGETVRSERRAVVAVAECCAVGVAETGASTIATPAVGFDETSARDELVALAKQLDAGGELSVAQTDRLRAGARAGFAVVISPAAGEILLRSADDDGQVTVRRHRFLSCVTPSATGSASASPGSTDDSARSALPSGTGPIAESSVPRSGKRAETSVDSPLVASQHRRSSEHAEDVDNAVGGKSSVPPMSVPPGLVLPVVPIEEYLAALQSVDGRPPFDRDSRVCSRFVLRLLETSIPPVDEAAGGLSGPAMIVGSNPVGLVLRRQIEALGQQAVVVPVADDAEKTLALVEKIWEAYRPPHLFIVTPFDADAAAGVEPAEWARRRRRGVMLPYLVCQRWFTLLSAAKMVEQGSLVAATAAGGDFGLSGRLSSCESGALAGLVKAMTIEVGYTTNWAFRTKVVDVPADEPPEEVAAAALRELRANAFVAEVGYRAGRRYVVGTMHRPTQPAPDSTPTRGRPWLVTGGARGITAAVARELGARFGVKLHLVGTSPRTEINPAWRDLSPEGEKQLRAELARQAVTQKKVPAELWRGAQKAIEIDRNLRSLAESGIKATYHACDVGDRAAVAALVDEIRRTDGPIEGVIHGAGIEVACRLSKKDPAVVSKTLAAKVDGAAALMELLGDDVPRFFFGFGSIAGRLGSIGQTDYAAASDMLAKLIDRYRVEHPGCRAACFHWQPWDDVGMAVRNETRGGGMLQNLRMLPATEGVEWFFDELLAGAPEPEVLITDWDLYKKFYPDLSAKEIAEIYSPATGQGCLGHSEAVAQTSSSITGSANAALPAASCPLPATDHVAQRHVMRIVEAPLEGTTRRPFTFSGPALILGNNADAEALARRLAAAGVEARQIPIHETIDATLSELQWLWADRPAPHLFLMTGRDPAARRIASRQDWAARRALGVMLPYAVCQKWLAMVTDAELLDRASLVATTSLGGDFGFAGRVLAPEGGAVAGLVKGLYTELNATRPVDTRFKVVDAPDDEPPDVLARAIVAELDVEGVDIEVACVGGRRCVVRMAIEPAENLPREELPRGGTWIFTGGARGITAEVAKVMGRRYGLTLHLLGKSPEPAIDPAWRELDDAGLRALKRSLVRQATAEGRPAGTYWQRVRKDLEIDRNLRELAAAGIRATYHSCDVGDADQLELVVERIRQADGPIEGIVHGAGILGDSKSIGELPLAELVLEIDVKVDAAMNMLLAADADAVRYFVGFGSISGRFGSNNASIYSMSSDMLVKLAAWQRTRRPGCHAVGFHWHPWGEVGMMTHPSSRHTITVMKMKMMPPAEGAEHLIEELCAGTPESEVLITDRQYYETFYSKDLLLPAAAEQAAPSAPAGSLVNRVALVEPGRRATIETVLDPVADPFLREHLLRGRPTLPMVVALEAMAEAAAVVTGGAPPAAIRDVQIPDAVRFLSDEPREVRVHAEVGDAGVPCRLVSDFRNRRGQLVQKDRPHFSGTIEPAVAPRPIDATLPPPRGQWHEMQYPSRDALMYHGPPLRLLRRVAVEGAEAWGQIDLPKRNELAGPRDPAGWLTPSAALDACYYACGVHLWICADGAVGVPESLAEIRFGRAGRPSEHCTVHVACRELTEKLGRFDFTLFGDDGTVIFQVTGYQCHVLRGASL